MTRRPALPALLALALGLAPAGPVRAAAPAPAAAEADLAARIDAFLAAPRFAAATWGIQVRSLDTGRVLYQRDAGRLLVPASNTKLFTAALALRTLGPEFRIRTSLYATARPGPDGVLDGDLVLYGRGDPTLLRPGSAGPRELDPMESLAAALAAQGVRRVRGDLVGDDRFFTAAPYGPGWEWEDLQHGYGAEPTALAAHGNAVDLWIHPAPVAGRPCFVFVQPGQGLLPIRNRTTTASGAAGIRVERRPGEETLRITGGLPPGAPPAHRVVAVRDGARFAAGLLARALERHGIRVLGRVRAAHAGDEPAPGPDRLAELAHLDSPPLRAILRDLMKDSLNLDAQLVLLQAGARAAAGAGDSAQAGRAALARFLEQVGLRPGEYAFEDGAGGSRQDLVTPAAIVKLLAYMDAQPEAAAFRAALPVAGRDGTLRRRMLDTPAEGNVQAKTGTLRYTYTLSGYFTTQAAERLAFSFMLNNYKPGPEPGPSPQQDLDALAAILARFQARNFPG